MTNPGLAVAACTSLLLAACGHVRGNLARPVTPAAAEDEAPGATAVWVSETAEPAAPPATEPPAAPDSECASGYAMRGVLNGIAIPLGFCIAGGPITLILCGAAISACPGGAIGILAGSAALGGLIGGANGAAKCPRSPPAAAPPPTAPEPPPEPAEPTSPPSGGSPGVSWLPAVPAAAG